LSLLGVGAASKPSLPITGLLRAVGYALLDVDDE
jgi:hypothetical protein